VEPARIVGKQGGTLPQQVSVCDWQKLLKIIANFNVLLKIFFI
jgi:hypothetical protein